MMFLRVRGSRRLRRYEKFLVVVVIISVFCFCFMTVTRNVFTYHCENGCTTVEDRFDKERTDEIDSLSRKIKDIGTADKKKAASALTVAGMLVEKYRVDLNHRLPPGQSPWAVARDWVNSQQIVPDEAPELGAILRAMTTARVIRAEDWGTTSGGGHQPKLFLRLEGGQYAIFKPKWYNRDFLWPVTSTDPDHDICFMHDHHAAEIAAFHVARILGLKNVPLAVGRRVKLHVDILPVASPSLLKTVFHNATTNQTCFYGNCTFCSFENDQDTTVCVKGDDELEGVVILLLPDHAKPMEFGSMHPWLSLCYDKGKKTSQLTQIPNYCDALLNEQIEPWVKLPEKFLSAWMKDIMDNPNVFYNNPKLFLDLVDSAILQYIISNYDRKMYTIEDGPAKGLLVNLDNGKSLYHDKHDVRALLAPLYHCCRVREATYQRLLLLRDGTLGQVAREVLNADPISPVLADGMYSGMDRRLQHVLDEIDQCAETRGVDHVFRFG